MSVITLEIYNENTLQLLKHLEVMNVVRVIKTETSERIPTIRKRRFAGTISQKTADLLLLHIENTRNEWENS
jgi:hypothetical protein